MGETLRAPHMNVDVPEYAVHDEVCVDPARTALVVIDMQNDFVKQGGSLLVPDAEATVPAIRGLLDLARAARMRVVYSQDTHRQGDPEWQLWPEHCREGSWGWEIVAELAPEVDDVVLRKVRYDVFYGTPLDHLLRLWGIDTLIICGTVANICVHYTAASAALRWYASRDPARCDLGARAVRSRGIVAPDRVRVLRALDDGGRAAHSVTFAPHGARETVVSAPWECWPSSAPERGSSCSQRMNTATAGSSKGRSSSWSPAVDPSAREGAAGRSRERVCEPGSAARGGAPGAERGVGGARRGRHRQVGPPGLRRRACRGLSRVSCGWRRMGDGAPVRGAAPAVRGTAGRPRRAARTAT